MKFSERKERIKKLKKELDKLRVECTHPTSQVTKKANGSSGNWDPMDDKSWDELKCNVCDHFWTEDH